MEKVYTKAELFNPKTTLKQLQQIATKLDIPFETDNNKATLANLILKKQQEIKLTTPEPEETAGEGMTAAGEPLVGENGGEQAPTNDGPAPGVDDKTVEEVAAENKKAGMVDDLGERELPPVSSPATTPAPESEAKPVKLTDEVLEAIKNRLGVDAIAERLRKVERFVEKEEAKDKNAGTLHGSIDALPRIEDLPPPGRIDDLPKIG